MGHSRLWHHTLHGPIKFPRRRPSKAVHQDSTAGLPAAHHHAGNNTRILEYTLLLAVIGVMSPCILSWQLGAFFVNALLVILVISTLRYSSLATTSIFYVLVSEITSTLATAFMNSIISFLLSLTSWFLGKHVSTQGNTIKIFKPRCRTKLRNNIRFIFYFLFCIDLICYILTDRSTSDTA